MKLFKQMFIVSAVLASVGCTTVESTVSEDEQLDKMYYETPGLWESQMDRYLNADDVIAPRHWARYLPKINSTEDIDETLRVNYRFFDAKAHFSESLSSNETRLFRHYAEQVIEEGRISALNDLNRLCRNYRTEPACEIILNKGV